MFKDDFLTMRPDFLEKRDSRAPYRNTLEKIRERLSHPAITYTFMKRESYIFKVKVPIYKKDLDKGVICQYFIYQRSAYVKRDEWPDWAKKIEQKTKTAFEEDWRLRKEV